MTLHLAVRPGAVLIEDYFAFANTLPKRAPGQRSAALQRSPFSWAHAIVDIARDMITETSFLWKKNSILLCGGFPCQGLPG